MKSYIIWILLFISQLTLAQDEWLNFTNNYFVTDVLETEEALWLGSSGGLCHFDSNMNEAVYYNRGNSEIPSNNINDLFQDSNGDIWITTSLGICKFSNEEFILGPERLSGILEETPDNKMVVANYDSLYIQTDNMNFDAIAYPNFVAGIGGFEIDPEGAIYINVINYFAETYIAVWKDNEWEIIFSDFIYESSMTMDHQNKLWFLSSAGLQYYENDAWVDVPAIDSLDAFNASGLSVDLENNILIEIRRECPELFKWDGTNLTQIEFSKDLCEDCHFVKPSSRESNRYFATNRRQGFYTFSADNIADYEPYTQSPLSYNHAINTLHPSDGSHIIVHFDKIQKLTNGNWGQIPLPTNIQGPINYAQLDADDVLWLNTGEVLWFYKDQQWNTLSLPHDITDKIDIMIIGKDGTIWIQSHLTIARYQNDQWQNFRTAHHDISSSIIQDIQIDPQNGDLWVSTFQGIRHFDGLTWSRYDIPSVNHTFGLAIGNDGVYVRASDGMYFIQNGMLESMAMPQEGYFGSFESEMIFDHDNNKLYLTGTNALAEYHNGEWEVYNTNNAGVYNGYTNDINIDTKGNLWLTGSEGGVGVFNAEGIVLSNSEIHLSNDKFGIKVFPTLVQGNKIFIKSGHSGNFDITISDSTGRILQRNQKYLPANQLVEYDLPSTKTAILFVTVSQKNKLLTTKIIRLE